MLKGESHVSSNETRSLCKGPGKGGHIVADNVSSFTRALTLDDGDNYVTFHELYVRIRDRSFITSRGGGGGGFFWGGGQF